jgi:hypothetical protein
MLVRTVHFGVPLVPIQESSHPFIWLIWFPHPFDNPDSAIFIPIAMPLPVAVVMVPVMVPVMIVMLMLRVAFMVDIDIEGFSLREYRQKCCRRQ